MKNSGIINVNKEKGYTSHDVVAIIKKITGTKAGHTGTLDPNATGVLPICLGRATKLADYIAATEKEYTAQIIFGITTNTGDITGLVVAQKTRHCSPMQPGEIITQTDPPNITLDQLQTAVESFTFANRGIYMQTPPMYSAIKIGGKKMYQLARKGETIEIPPRPVKIHEASAFADSDKYYIKVRCSKGTYIRSLCMDIGELLGCGAVMGDLTRTKSGTFSIENALTLDQIRQATLTDIITPADKILPYPALSIKPDALKHAINGNPIPINMLTTPPDPAHQNYWLYTPCKTKLIGLYKTKGQTLRAEVYLYE